ncbi:hypothetical protein JCM10914A_13520 [Paenibacillus sp. JCM 10914]
MCRHARSFWYGALICTGMNGRRRGRFSEGEEHRSTTENFIVATVDTALAAQNAAVAAESLGLGIVYIGGLRNDPGQVLVFMRCLCN